MPCSAPRFRRPARRRCWRPGRSAERTAGSGSSGAPAGVDARLRREERGQPNRPDDCQPPRAGRVLRHGSYEQQPPGAVGPPAPGRVRCLRYGRARMAPAVARNGTGRRGGNGHPAGSRGTAAARGTGHRSAVHSAAPQGPRRTGTALYPEARASTSSLLETVSQSRRASGTRRKIRRTPVGQAASRRLRGAPPHASGGAVGRTRTTRAATQG